MTLVYVFDFPKMNLYNFQNLANKVHEVNLDMIMINLQESKAHHQATSQMQQHLQCSDKLHY